MASVILASSAGVSGNGSAGPAVHSIAKRLQSELMNIMMSSPPGVSAFPNDGNFLQWTATIHGVSGTAYESLEYKLSLQFPADYPFSAPVVKFITPCFHPNVDDYGNICLDILKDKWSACYNVSTVLLSIQSLLGEPNNDSPLNTYAAQLWSNQNEYKQVLLSRNATSIVSSPGKKS